MQNIIKPINNLHTSIFFDFFRLKYKIKHRHTDIMNKSFSDALKLRNPGYELDVHEPLACRFGTKNFDKMISKSA